MVKTYEGHVITVSGAATTRSQWDLRIAVIWPEQGVNKIRTFTVKPHCNSYDQAITRGIVWAKHWIDGGRPNQPPTAC